MHRPHLGHELETASADREALTAQSVAARLALRLPGQRRMSERVAYEEHRARQRSDQAIAALAGSELGSLARNWWMMAARGALAVSFGVAILVWHVPVFSAVVVSFGTYAIADGILAIASVFRAGSFRRAGWAIALEGAVSVALGALTLNWPAFPQRVIDTLIVWGIGTGLMELAAAAAMPRAFAAHWLFATAGASSLFLAVALLGMPHAYSDRAATALAVYAIAFGLIVSVASMRFRLRR